MTSKRSWLSLASLAVFLFASAQSFAGGPLILRAPGAPYLWPNGGLNIPYNPDQGALGPLGNAAAVAQTTAAFQAWQNVASSTVTYVNAGPLPVDVDVTNFFPFLFPTAPDGLSAVVYDANGAIFSLLFGSSSGVLGFAGPEWVNTVNGDILEGVAFMNGGAIVGGFPVAEFFSVQVHEFGHYSNLAHTVVNGQIVLGDTNGPTPFNTFPPVSLFNRIETMYPFLIVNGGQATPHADDIAIISTLYPEPTFAGTTGAIAGTILAPNATSPVTGVNVIARNVSNPFDDAVSAISSDFTDDFTSGAPLVGTYTIRGLTPGASYAVFVDEIFAGGFSTPPRSPLPGPEEFYNGVGESNDGTLDLPNVFTPVLSVAGSTAGGIDIVFNRRLPGPLPLGLDETIEIFPAFPIRFCGQTFDSVWVNTSGNLTFGAGDPFGFFESPARLLTGPPRIAALWDDLNPDPFFGAGTVSFAETAASITFSWTGVPEFVNTGSNTFSVTLFAARAGDDDDDEGDDDDDGPTASRFVLTYNGLTATDGLAGYSCGGKIASGFEQETDLSPFFGRTVKGGGKTAVFEAFTAADNDLANRSLAFTTPSGFRDVFEPNDALPPFPGGDDEDGDDEGEDDDDEDDDDDGLVRLPFNTAGSFAEIRPLGGDVDVFRFRARAGDILLIETVPGGPLDSLIGLFDSAGNLLALDDDGGVGLLSRLFVTVPADGVYAAAVTTWPDFGFTGAGFDVGRYVLHVNTYRGAVVDPGDDGSIQVPLSTFTFPFQGTDWSTVFVNANGNLTFGAASFDFSESVPEFLNGPPRIAPLWDDLTPSFFFTGVQGLVVIEEADKELRVHYVSVPEFLSTGTNTVTTVLDRKGNITFEYGPTNRSDGIVGVTEGAGATDPGPINLSGAFRFSAQGTTYERFVGSFTTYGGVDLSFRTLKFRR